MNIRQATKDDTERLAAFVEEWSGRTVVIGGEVVDAAEAEALIAGDFAGVLTFRVTGDTAEMLTFSTAPPLGGIGSALLAALLPVLRGRGVARLIVYTTNDHVNALRFYQRRGFRLTELRPDAMTHARRLNPAIPVEGVHRIPVRDELVLTLTL